MVRYDIRYEHLKVLNENRLVDRIMQCFFVLKAVALVFYFSKAIYLTRKSMSQRSKVCAREFVIFYTAILCSLGIASFELVIGFVGVLFFILFGAQVCSTPVWLDLWAQNARVGIYLQR